LRLVAECSGWELGDADGPVARRRTTREPTAGDQTPIEAALGGGSRTFTGEARRFAAMD